MGRIAGVSADETRERLLTTAAGVFGRLGYDGASIARISSEAGLSSGAIYAHYAGKAELFVATLRAHAEVEVERLIGQDGAGVDVASFLRERGESLQRHDEAERALLFEAIVAARRHPDVAQVLSSSLARREGRLADLLRGAQAVGAIDPRASADTIVRFSLMVALGSMVVAALDLPPTDHDDWSRLIGRLIENIRTVEAPHGEEAPA